MSERTLTQLESLHDRVIACTACDRLRAYCRDVGVTRRAAYRDWDYWTRPVPGFGDPRARLWILGLAPGAHGANRTGRIFTGDRSGDFLYAALHRAGFASQPISVSRDDGLTLTDCYVSAVARCAPPENKPSSAEVEACAPFLDAEWRLLMRKRVILALGKIAWDAALRLARRARSATPRTQSAFAHGAVLPIGGNLTLIGSYHVSQQNTFTGRLTTRMFDDVLARCRAHFI
jgi:uracil-DNA glycosylase family 4